MTTLEGAIEKAHRWIADMKAETGWTSSQRCWTAIRAVLHALRDRLGDVEGAQLAAQLPTMFRGVWYDGWRPGRPANAVRTREDFLALVKQHALPIEFLDVEQVVRAVLGVLAQHVSPGEIDSVRHVLPRPIAAWLPTSASLSHARP